MRPGSLAAICLGLLLVCSGAGAAGGGGGGGGGGGDDGDRRVQDADYKAAMVAVKANDWSTVITRMSNHVARQPGDADGWNELGHAQRKIGNLDAAFKAYAKALQIDPKHRNAHEYLGEAYLQVGDLASAEGELRALDKLCFLRCEQYDDLEDEIRRYKLEHPPLASR